MFYMPVRYKDDVMLILNTEVTLMFVAKKVGNMVDVFGVTAFDECLVDRFYNDTDHLLSELMVYPVEEEMLFQEVMNLNEDWLLDHILGGYCIEK